jgi:hypothetical protein
MHIPMQQFHPCVWITLIMENIVGTSVVILTFCIHVVWLNVLHHHTIPNVMLYFNTLHNNRRRYEKNFNFNPHFVIVFRHLTQKKDVFKHYGSSIVEHFSIYLTVLTPKYCAPTILSLMFLV